MSILWIFAPQSRSLHSPAINGQLEQAFDGVLTLRNPWIPDSVFMGKMFSAGILFMIVMIYPSLLIEQPWNDRAFNSSLFMDSVLVPFIFAPFLMFRIWLIKNLSSFYFNRTTQKIYFTSRGTLTTLDWGQTVGGFYKITEIINGSYTTSHALALAVPRPDGTLHKKDCLWVDSNEPSDPSITMSLKSGSTFVNSWRMALTNSPLPGSPTGGTFRSTQFP